MLKLHSNLKRMNKLDISTCIAPSKKLGLVDTNTPLSVLIVTNDLAKGKSQGSKSLFNYQNHPFIYYQVKTILSVFPVADIVVSAGYEADKIYKEVNEVKFLENENYRETGTVKNISLAIKAVKPKNLLIINNNIYFNEGALRRLGLDKNFIVSSKEVMGKDNIGVNVIGNKVASFHYDFPSKFCDIVYIKGGDLNLLHQYCNIKNNYKCLLYEVLDKMIDAGTEFINIDMNSGIKEIITQQDLTDAH